VSRFRGRQPTQAVPRFVAGQPGYSPTVPRFLLCLVVLLLAGCTGPVRSFNVYESKAGTTAEATASAVETARLTVDAAVEGRAFGRYTAQSLAETWKDASAVQGTFDSIQPPDRRADRLRDELDELLEQAVSTLAELRTAARRGHNPALARIAEPLGDLAAKLDAFAEAHA
jgi:microsomal dipeptidase-like Zn-dependent dipeptidase